MGQRGEVVDDLRRRRRDRRACGGRVAQVDGHAAGPGAGARQRHDVVAGRDAGTGEMAAGEARRARDQDAPAQGRGRTGGDHARARAVAVGRDGRLVDRQRDRLGRVEPPLQLAQHEAEQHVAPGRLRERAARAPELRQLGARGVHAIDHRGARPRRQVLGEPGQRTAQRGRHRQRGGDVRVGSAEQRAVGEMQPDAGRLPSARAHDEPAEQLRVVIGDAEDAPVERLLRRPDGGRRGARERSAQRPLGGRGHGADCNEQRPFG